MSLYNSGFVRAAEKPHPPAVPAQVRNLPNYWSGSWRGRFTVTLGAARKATLAGSLSVRTHYFENGNVQVGMGGEESCARRLAAGTHPCE